MSAVNLPLPERDLHAYADGVLAGQRRADVIAYLAARPDETERLLGWQRQNELLRATFPLVEMRSGLSKGRAPFAKLPAQPALARHDPTDAAPLKASAQDASSLDASGLDASAAERSLRRRRGAAGAQAAGLLIAGAVIVLMALQFVGGATGWLERGSPARLGAMTGSRAGVSLPDGVVRRALEAHVVFAEDREVPAEFDAHEPAQLEAYLSRRIGASVRAPNLSLQGLRLLGGRVVPLAEGVAAMLIYDAGAGPRVALTIARLEAAGEFGQRFQQTDSGAAHAARWLAGDEVYVLTSAASRAETLSLAAAAATGVEAARAVAR